MVLGVIPKGRGKKSGNASDSPTTSTTEPVEVVKEPEESAKTQIPPESADPKVVTKARRRLSVDGHDVSLDGIEDIGIVDGYGGTPVQEKELTKRSLSVPLQVNLRKDMFLTILER